MAPPSKRIIVTGFSGKAGRAMLPSLLAAGYQVLNLDLMPLPAPLSTQVHTLRTDLTDSGQIFNALSSTLRFSEPLDAVPKPWAGDVDAVIHFAGVSSPMQVPDNEMFRVNVMGTMNVVDAACKLGIKKVVIASSVTVYGVTYANGKRSYEEFPVDESHSTRCTDSYALSKVCAERVAEGYAGRFGVDVYCLRIGRVTLEEEYHNEMFRSYVEEPEKWAVHGWTYIDARDLAQMVKLCVEKSGLGFQVFNAINDSITSYIRTSDILGKYAPETPIKGMFQGREGPLSNKKIRDMLGFTEEHHWRKYYGNEEHRKQVLGK